MSYANRLDKAMEHARATTSTLARALGVTYQAIAKIADGRSKSLSAENNDKAARFLGVDPSWLATGLGPMLKQTETSPLMAHAMSLHSFTVPTSTREDLMNGEIPARFVFELDDDAMGTHGRRGTQVLFERAHEARIGAGVMVKDSSGQIHIRRLSQGRSPGHWLAVAPNEHYRNLDSEADGLELLAVWRGVVNKGLEDL